MRSPLFTEIQNQTVTEQSTAVNQIKQIRKKQSNSNKKNHQNNGNNKSNSQNKKQNSPKKHNNKSPKKSKKNNKPKKHQKPNPKKEYQELTLEQQSRYVAMDCEMVGIGPGGYKSALARVSLVDYNACVLLDTFVKVDEPVTNYRTFVSGVTEEDLISDSAMEEKKCVDLVKKLLEGKILVGHGLKNDLGVLGIDHPWYDIRDTAKYEPFMKKQKKGASASALPQPRKLKDLALTKLNREIQKEGEAHCSIEDAVAALDLYKKARGKWEDVMEYKITRTMQIEFLENVLEEQEQIQCQEAEANEQQQQ